MATQDVTTPGEEQAEVAFLKEELASLRDEMKRMAQMRKEESGDPVAQLTAAIQALKPATTPSEVYVAPARRCERFSDRPKSDGGLNMQDWVADMRSTLKTRKLAPAQQAAFIIEHLSGRARQEIQGRGATVTANAEEIFRTLLRVFGDGASVGQLRSRFYTYQQKAGDDVLTCSLELYSLLRRIEGDESSFGEEQNTILKERLAEAVRDDALKRELRRLNIESPNLDYFDLRDRAVQWQGTREPVHKRSFAVEEVGTSRSDTALHERVRDQEREIRKLRTMLSNLQRELEDGRGRQRNVNRTCFECNSRDHLVRSCPQAAARRANQQPAAVRPPQPSIERPPHPRQTGGDRPRQPGGERSQQPRSEGPQVDHLN